MSFEPVVLLVCISVCMYVCLFAVNYNLLGSTFVPYEYDL